MFIRFFADTTGSTLSVAALEYMRALMRMAPVRLVSVTGPLAGRWIGYGQLFATPMLGGFVNCVACDPSRWVWKQHVPMGESQINIAEIGAGRDLTVPAAEIATGNVELYTHGKRNVLFAIAVPRTKADLAAAKKYTHIVVPHPTPPGDLGDWEVALGRQPDVVPVPVPDIDRGYLRSIVGL